MLFFQWSGMPLRKSILQQVLGEKGLAVNTSMLCCGVVCTMSLMKRASGIFLCDALFHIRAERGFEEILARSFVTGPW